MSPPDPPGHGGPGQGPVDLWLAEPAVLDRAGCRDALWSVLSGEERARHDRFWFLRDRDLFLASHGLVRSVLARRTGTPAGALRFRTNAHGRPELEGDAARAGLCFNLSHTRGLVALAVAGREVGVDVEGMRPVDLRVADRFFAPEEVRALEALPPAARRGRFYAYWTLKESYIKARGMGLALPLDGFAFHLLDGGGLRFSARADVDPAPERWRFALLAPTEEHRAALALDTESPLRWRAWRWRGPFEPDEMIDPPLLAITAPTW